MDNALRYERFIQDAAKFLKEEGIKTDENLTGLAEADLFNDSSKTAKVKRGISHTMEMYNSYLKEHFAVSDNLQHRMDTILEDVSNASSTDELNVLIQEYQTSFVNRYIS